MVAYLVCGPVMDWQPLAHDYSGIGTRQHHPQMTRNGLSRIDHGIYDKAPPPISSFESRLA